MAKPKHHRGESPRPPHPGEGTLPVPEELKGIGGLHVHADEGGPATYTFSLEFPATLTAIVRSEETGGYSAEVPALPGCFTEGETLEELRESLKEAAEGWLRAHHDLTSADLLRSAREAGEDR